MSFYTNVREDSTFVYGNLYELLELLNTNDLRFYVKNEKKINLLKEFKYRKKKRVDFVGALDYFANRNDKESEFVVCPIIFNQEYEVLHLGVSVFFSDSFSYYYKKEKYNYIELYIRNIEKSIIRDTNKTSGNHSSNVDEEEEDDIRINCDILINLRNLKSCSEQKPTKKKIPLYNADSVEINNNNIYHPFKNGSFFMKNSRTYTHRNEAGKDDNLGIYSEEYGYRNNSNYVNISSNNNEKHNVDNVMYSNENGPKGKIDMILTENVMNRDKEGNQIEPKDLHHHYYHNHVYMKEEGENVSKENTLHDEHCKFRHSGDTVNDSITCLGEQFNSVHLGVRSSFTTEEKEFSDLSKEHMSNDVLFSKIASVGHIENRNESRMTKEKKESRTIFSSGYHSSKGNRTYNEDRVINIENISEFLRKEMDVINESKKNNIEYDKEYEHMLLQLGCVEKAPSYAYCAIYDGHNGENAVNTVQKYLHLNIHMYFLNGNEMNNSIKCGFKAIDKKVCERTSTCEEDNHSNYSSGTTACVTIILKNMLYIGNIGDSRCVLSKNGRAVVLTVDHRASVNKKEQNRIINCGGTLDDEGYLGGCLGVCRGFGSFEKITKTKLKGLICDPDIFQIKLTDDDEFLIICCDGIFDVMTSQEAVNTVRMSLIQNASADAAAEELCNLAYSRKSLDNLSSVVVVFQKPANEKKSSSNENVCFHSAPSSRMRRRIPFSALKSLLSP